MKDDKPACVIEGRRLRLRNVRIEDATDIYAAWMNDPEVVRYTESRFTRHTLVSLRRFIETVIARPNALFLAIIVKPDGRHIGNIKLDAIDSQHGTAEVGIIIGDKNYWGRGYGSEAIDLLASYAFGALGLRKLTAGIYVNNADSIRSFERAGFVVEAVLKDHCISDGKTVDVLRIGRWHEATP
ncbi:MAG: GNAT family N-acetyltransferase [Rhodospirillales bacterium]